MNKIALDKNPVDELDNKSLQRLFDLCLIYYSKIGNVDEHTDLEYYLDTAELHIRNNDDPPYDSYDNSDCKVKSNIYNQLKSKNFFKQLKLPDFDQYINNKDSEHQKAENQNRISDYFLVITVVVTLLSPVIVAFAPQLLPLLGGLIVAFGCAGFYFDTPMHKFEAIEDTELKNLASNSLNSETNDYAPSNIVGNNIKVEPNKDKSNSM